MSFSVELDGFSKKISALNNPTMNQSLLGVYIGCNETETDVVQEILGKCKQLTDAAHIGFSGWHNFDIMVQRKSGRGLLCDFNPDTKKFIESSLMALQNSNTRQLFASVMTRYVVSNFSKFSPNVKGDGECLLPDEEVEEELSRNGSWLSTDDGYSYIKRLASEGKICAITEDIRNEKVFEQISKRLKENMITIDTLYVSNIADYMHTKEDKSSYQKTISHLLTFETKLVHCGDNLRQTVLFGLQFTIKAPSENDLFIRYAVRNNAQYIEKVTKEAQAKISIKDQ